MAVTRTQDPIMLDGECRDPQVVGRDWATLLAELSKNLRVRMGRSVICVHHLDSRFI